MLTYDRCGEEYSTDRETPIEHGNNLRCPSCGKENKPEQRPTQHDAEAYTDGGVPDVVNNIVDKRGTDRNEVHLHVHFHN